VAEEEPALCREVIAAHPGEPLEALRKAEMERMQRVRSAWRRGKHVLWDSLGMGATEHTRRLAHAFGRASEEHRRALYEARVICGCRERRGDPYREDCDALFRLAERQYGRMAPPPGEAEGEEEAGEAGPRDPSDSGS
jgi:hypothetical protein